MLAHVLPDEVLFRDVPERCGEGRQRVLKARVLGRQVLLPLGPPRVHAERVLDKDAVQGGRECRYPRLAPVEVLAARAVHNRAVGQGNERASGDLCANHQATCCCTQGEVSDWGEASSRK